MLFRSIPTLRDPHLVRVDTAVERRVLGDSITNCIAVQAMHGERARQIVRGEHVAAGGIDTTVNRAGRQRDPVHEFESAVTFHGEGREMMGAAASVRPAVARRHIQHAPIRVRPRIVNLRRQVNREAAVQ